MEIILIGLFLCVVVGIVLWVGQIAAETPAESWADDKLARMLIKHENYLNSLLKNADNWGEERTVKISDKIKQIKSEIASRKLKAIFHFSMMEAEILQSKFSEKKAQGMSEQEAWDAAHSEWREGPPRG